MELRHLRYFLRVAEERHFGRAALRLGISQPPLSQQIRALEEELGVVLFERTSRRVQLTEAGRLFLPEAQRTIEQADRAAATARRAQRGEMGELRLGFTASAPFVPAISEALFAFRGAFPDVQLNLSELPRDDQIERLRDRRLDCGIVRGIEPPALPGSLLATPLLEEALMIAMRTDHPLAGKAGAVDMAQLRDEAWVLYEPHLGAGFNEHLLDLCRGAGFLPEVTQEAVSLASLLGLVVAGFGLTVLAQSLTTLHPDRIAYRPIAQVNAVTRLWLVRPRDMTPACGNFVRIIGA